MFSLPLKTQFKTIISYASIVLLMVRKNKNVFHWKFENTQMLWFMITWKKWTAASSLLQWQRYDNEVRFGYSYSRSQLTLSCMSWKLSSHEHTYDPAVLLHSWWHGCSVTHSSMSGKKYNYVVLRYVTFISNS